MTFADFGLNKEILSAIESMGFETPTEIQNAAIPFMLEKPESDLVGLAQTGTGKTAAFGLPIIQTLQPDIREPQALILCPTRELCLQITSEMENYAKNMRKTRFTAVYGGASIADQIREIRRGTQVIIATPGRLLDLIRREKADLSRIRNLVLDEADIMLNMGFKEELDGILEETPETKRVVLFSATMPPEVARIADTYMRDSQEISIGRKNSSAANIEHFYYMVHSRDKYAALKRLLDYHPDIYGIVFCRTRISTQQIADNLIKDGYNAESLHGDLSQAQRNTVMKKFRDMNIQILVATDVAARGLDVDNLTHVIHFDLPDDADSYVHRSGRTGRVGRKGVSLAILNMREKHKVLQIERRMKGKITPSRIPNGPAICEKQLIALIDRVHTVKVDEEQIEAYMPVIEEKLASLDRDALLKHFVSLEFQRFLDYYRDAGDINPPPGQRKTGRNSAPSRGRNERHNRGENVRFDTVRLNVGRRDKVLPPQIIKLIGEATFVRNIELGYIKIESSWSTLQVDAQYTGLILEKLNGYKYRGKMIRASRDQLRKGQDGKKPYGRKRNERKR